MGGYIETIEKNCLLYADQTAVSEENESIHYKELWTLSARVYAYLNRQMIGPEDVVMIQVSSTIHTVIACVGVLRAGAAFVIAEQDTEQENLLNRYADCGCRMWIDDLCFRQMLNEEGISGYKTVSEHTAAYVIYTSGSTRNPKGVMLERGAMTLCRESACYQGQQLVSAGDRVALVSPLTFAAGMILMTITLSCGASLYAVSPDTTTSPAALARYFRENRITMTFMTPTLYRICHEFNPEMKRIALGGEPLEDITPVDFELYNMYGQSESGFIVALQKIDRPWQKAPIGLPQKEGIHVRILDEKGMPVRDGEMGELCYENPYFRGYIGREAETRYILRGGIIHSGDLCTLLADGTLQIAGRNDDMVKIHGLQVKTSEIEMAVLRCFDADQVIVRCMTESTKVFICVYYTGKTEIDPEDARGKLRGQLPEHMLPTHFIHLERIPTNRNGKADIQKLPLPAAALPGRGRTASNQGEGTASNLHKDAVADRLEEELAAIAGDVLEYQEPIGKDTNLISLGMSSLTSIRLIGEIEERYKARLTLAQVMEQPDIAHICERIRHCAGMERTRNSRPDLSDPAAGTGIYFPLAKNQLAMLAECEANRYSVQYNIPSGFSFPRSEMDPGLLKDVIQRSADLHRVFSARIVRRKDVPAASRIPGCEVYQTFTDEPVVIRFTRREKSFDSEEQAKTYLQEKVMPYDLFQDRLYRIEMIETPERLYLFFDIHHIIADGYSLEILADDITRFLEGKPVSGERLTFAEYIAQKAKTGMFDSDDRTSTQRLLAGLNSFRYPYRLPGEDDLPHRIATIRKEIDMGDIPAYCRGKNLTQSSYFHAALLLTLYLLTGEKPFIATTYSGRAERPEELMRTAGFFAKSVPVVWNPDEETPEPGHIRPEDFIHDIQAQIMDICSRDSVIYSDLAARTDVLLTFQGELGAFFINIYKGIELELQTPVFPIRLLVKFVGRTYDISLIYDEVLFCAPDMALLFDSFTTVLDRLRKAAWLREIPLTQEDPAAILQRRSGDTAVFENDRTWVQDFGQQVLQDPDHLAVLAGNGTYSYHELDEISGRVAAWLADQGVAEGDFVVIRMPRVKEFAAAVLGIHKCGAAYVPVDENYPEQRIAYILKNSSARIQITQETVLLLEAEEALSKCGGAMLSVKAKASGRAYMIYTSGSTGDPKGVVISHRALYNYLRYVRDEMRLNPRSRIGCYASFSFDISLEGLLSPLIAGGVCVIIPSGVRKDITALEAYLREYGVTGCCFPTQIGQLLGQREALDMEYLTLIGEKMTAVPGNRGHVYNAYGPTECTVVCTYYDVRKDRKYTDIPIGKPMYHTAVLLLDPFGNLLPDGAAGELCVTGAQLADGYHHKPEETARVFTPLLQSPCVRVYHTGDLARLLPDGNLVYIGRVDRQIKRNGYRIEPGEIENAAVRLPAVKEAVAAADRNKLILYYTLHDTKAAAGGGREDEIRQKLEEELPAYMLPDGYMCLEAMPLTPNGKIDSKKLPGYRFRSKDYVPPVSEKERFVCERMARILHVEKVGMQDDFFDLGGNSLDAVQLALAMGEGFEISDIYHGRTPGGILNESRDRRRFYGYDRRSIYPLTEEQKKYFFLPDMVARPEISYANVPMLFQLPEETDLEALQTMLMQVIDHHPYLKVRYRENPDPCADAGEWYVAERDDSIHAQVSLIRAKTLDQETLIRPYNLLGDENMYRAALYELESGEKYLFWDFHHIVMDEQSSYILADDLKRLLAGQKLLPEKVSGFEVALDEKRRKEEEREEIAAYFRDLLKDCGNDIHDWINDRREIPTLLKWNEEFDEARGLACVMGSRVVRILESSLNIKDVRERCRSLRITENMFFNAAFSCLLGECNGKSKALYTNVIHNRDYEALQNTVTMLCRTVLIYLKVTEEELSSDHFLRQLRDVISNAGRGSVLSYEEICKMSGVRFSRLSMIFYDKPATREIIPGCRRIALNTLDSIDTIMLKIFYDEDGRLFLKFDASLDFSAHEIDLMAERMDQLISKL